MTTNAANLLEHPAVALLDELVRRPSVTPDDAGCQEILADRLNNAATQSHDKMGGESDR